MVKLSIIIPYYDTFELTKKLLLELDKQLTDEIEVIVIDDGCYEYNLPIIKNGYIVHLAKNSGGASIPRNIGIDLASGEYITFIDSDDMVSEDYISKIMKAISRNKDIIFLSWKSRKQQVIMLTQPPKWNCAVWCRVYKKSIIGNVRFDKNLRTAEDWKFNQEVKWETKECIKSIVYYYNNNRKGSLLHS